MLAMLDLLIAGFNCSLLCFGESGSGKTYTLTGEESAGVDGIIQLMIKDLFDKISTGYGKSQLNKWNSNDRYTLKEYMYHVKTGSGLILIKSFGSLFNSTSFLQL